VCCAMGSVFVIIKKSIRTRDRYLEYFLDHVTEPVPEFVKGMIFEERAFLQQGRRPREIRLKILPENLLLKVWRTLLKVLNCREYIIILHLCISYL
jgi:hypothetical protein